MEVYLVRHTETTVGKGVCYGHSDLPLKEPYKEQFKEILSQIKPKEAKIYSSPLIRCSLLANYLHLNSLNTEPISYDERLIELNFGEWELKEWDKIDNIVLSDWMEDFVNNRAGSGESFNQLYLRVNHFIENTLFREHNNLPSIIVTHAGVIRCFLCRERNIKLNDAFKIEVDFGSVYRIVIDKFR
jgi:alpha-ribazole phosphatase